MKHTSMIHRPLDRIDHVVSRLRKLWHYYPEESLIELIVFITAYANRVESEFPTESVMDIEDIPYPEGHILHHSRNLEMGMDYMEELHKDEPLPPTPIQTAYLSDLAERWRRVPMLRLGQFLTNNAPFFKEWEEDDS